MFEKENQLILNCLKTELKEAGSNNLNYSSDYFNSLDYQYITQILKMHGLPTIFYDFLKKNQMLQFMPTDFKNLLEKFYFFTSSRNLKFLNELKLIIQNLKKENIEVIPLKGIFLIEKVYNNISDRMMNDIDILVKEEKIDKSEQIILSLGYYSSEKKSVKEIMKIKHCHIAPLIKGNVCVEVHRHLIRESDQYKIDYNKIWENAKKTEISGEEAYCLSLEDMILHLSVHLTRNYGGKRIKLMHLVDIYKIINLNENILSWDKLINRAHEFKLEKYLYISLKLTEKIFRINYPEKINELESFCPKRQIKWFNSNLCVEHVINFQFTFLDELLWTEGYKSRWIVFKERVFMNDVSIRKKYSINEDSFLGLFLYFLRPIHLSVKQIKQTIKYIKGHKK